MSKDKDKDKKVISIDTNKQSSIREKTEEKVIFNQDIKDSAEKYGFVEGFFDDKTAVTRKRLLETAYYKRPKSQKTQQFWELPEQLFQLNAMAQAGLKKADIAAVIGIRYRTLAKWCNQSVSISSALDTGYTDFKIVLTTMMLDVARGSVETQTTYRIDKDGKKIPFQGKDTKKAPDIRALMYVLQNMDNPDKAWSDNQNITVEHSTTDTTSTVDTLSNFTSDQIDEMIRMLEANTISDKDDEHYRDELKDVTGE